MPTHSSVLAWRIPGTGDLVGCCLWGCTKSDTTEATQHQQQHTVQARLQQYVNRELPDVPAGFRKDRGTRDQIANIRWIIVKAREFQKNTDFCFINYAKAFDCVDHNKLEILQEMEFQTT